MRQQIHYDLMSTLRAGAVIVCDLSNQQGHIKTAGGIQRVDCEEIESLKVNGLIEHEDNASIRVWKVTQKAIR